MTSSEDIVRRNLEKPLHRHVHHHRPELPLAACSLSTSSASCASDLANPKAIATFSGERRTRLRVVPHQSQIAFSPPASCTCTPARTAWRHSRRDDPVPDTTTHTHEHQLHVHVHVQEPGGLQADLAGRSVAPPTCLRPHTRIPPSPLSYTHTNTHTHTHTPLTDGETRGEEEGTVADEDVDVLVRPRAGGTLHGV